MLQKKVQSFSSFWSTELTCTKDLVWWFSCIINKKKETENSNETKFCEVSYAMLYLFY